MRGAHLPEAEPVRAALRDRGDSLVVIRAGDLLKVHVHTDEPEQVFAYLGTLGSLAAHKAEDMQVQHAALGRAAGHLQIARRPLVVVSDSACDLPEEVVRAHGIQVVPLNLVVGDRTLRDGVDITPEEFAAHLRRGEPATTSQPAPAAFLEAYTRAAADGEAVLVVTLASALSGTFASAEAARKLVPAEAAPVFLVDSRGVSLTQGMLALRAAELAEHGWEAERIAAELERVRGQSGILFTLERYDRLLASGRVGRGRALLGSLLDIKPILGLDREGRVAPLGRVRGGHNVLPRVLDILAREIPAGARRVRLGVIHVDARATAEAVAAALRERFAVRDVLLAPATPVLAAHTGPGTWGVAYQVED